MRTLLVLLAGMAALTLPTVDESIVDRAVAPHKGKVVILNFWATWCGPCREEFPDLVRLYRENKGTTVLVTVSMDEPEDVDKAIAFLKPHGSDFLSYLRNFRDFEKFVNAVDPKWMGGIPATFVFDKNGKRVFGHEGQLTYAELKQVITPLVR